MSGRTVKNKPVGNSKEVQEPHRQNNDMKVSFNFSYVQQPWKYGLYVEKVTDDFRLSSLERIVKISNLTWKQCHAQGKHTIGGTEYLPLTRFTTSFQNFVKKIHESSEVKYNLTKMVVMRIDGDNRIMVGYREESIFFILAVEFTWNEFFIHEGSNSQNRK